MFIRKTTSKYKTKTYTNYLLVKSVHTAKGPRQKVICSLGDLSPRPARQWLELAHKIEDALVGQSSLLEACDPKVGQIVRQVRQRQSPKSHRACTKRHGNDEDLIAVHADQVRVERPRQGGFGSRGLPVLETAGHGGDSWRLGFQLADDRIDLCDDAQTG